MSLKGNKTPVKVNVTTPNVEVNVNQPPAPPNVDLLDLFHMAKTFKDRRSNSGKIAPHDLLEFYRGEMSFLDDTSGEVLSAEMKGSVGWNKVVKGRITEKFVHSAAVTSAKHTNDFLASKILGYGARVTRSESMRQNSQVKERVLASTLKVFKLPGQNLEPCGLYMWAQFPIFATSPDAISENYVYKVFVRKEMCHCIPNSL